VEVIQKNNSVKEPQKKHPEIHQSVFGSKLLYKDDEKTAPIIVLLLPMAYFYVFIRTGSKRKKPIKPGPYLIPF
jgi:hypothetical protein